MNLTIYKTKEEMAEAAAKTACDALKTAIKDKGSAAFVAATGASQYLFLEAMARDASIDWKKTTMFHLDEYVGVSDQHPASFRRYLRERLVDKTHPKEVFFIEGDAPDPEAEAIRLGEIISRYAIDVAFIGVGENAHVAFNDPPADFEVKSPYIVVNLDEACRRQQVGEGWFASVDEVPSRAITMSVSQIMKAKTIVCVVPDSRKAQAIENSFGTTDVNPMYPASILKRHPQAFVFLDKESGSLFDQKVRQ
jgi:glucosamine-6-phosphate deaminase